MSGGWQSVCTRTRDPKMQQQGCFSVAGILLCVWKSKASNGLNWERVHVRILWYWDVSSSGMPDLSFISFSLYSWMNFAQFAAPGRGCWCCALCRWDALCSAVFPGILLPNLCVFTGWATSLLCTCLWHLERAGRINIPVFPSHKHGAAFLLQEAHMSSPRLQDTVPQELLLFNLPLIDE